MDWVYSSTLWTQSSSYNDCPGSWEVWGPSSLTSLYPIACVCTMTSLCLDDIHGNYDHTFPGRTLVTHFLVELWSHMYCYLFSFTWQQILLQFLMSVCRRHARHLYLGVEGGETEPLLSHVSSTSEKSLQVANQNKRRRGSISPDRG